MKIIISFSILITLLLTACGHLPESKSLLQESSLSNVDVAKPGELTLSGAVDCKNCINDISPLRDLTELKPLDLSKARKDSSVYEFSVSDSIPNHDNICIGFEKKPQNAQTAIKSIAIWKRKNGQCDKTDQSSKIVLKAEREQEDGFASCPDKYNLFYQKTHVGKLTKSMGLLLSLSIGEQFSTPPPIEIKLEELCPSHPYPSSKLTCMVDVENESLTLPLGPSSVDNGFDLPKPLAHTIMSGLRMRNGVDPQPVKKAIKIPARTGPVFSLGRKSK